jgi:hypothetical protein
MTSSAQEAENRAAHVQGMAEAAAQDLERRAGTLLEVQGRELARRAEDGIAAWTERMRPALEQAGRETVVRLGTELEQQLQAGLGRAKEALGGLEEGTRRVSELERSHRDNLDRISQQAVESAAGRLRTALDGLEQTFEESGRAAATKWVAEIETKATDATHTTFESLFKTAEWYEKKVQTQMQTALEKGLDQASNSLREKAGEISGLFAAELDHYSRSYVAHTQEQVEEASRASLEHVRKQAVDMTAASATSLAQQTHHQITAALADFRTKTGAEISEASARMDSHTGQFRSRLDSEVQKSSAEFRTALGRETYRALGDTREELAAQVELSKTHLRNDIQAQEEQLRRTIASLSQEALEEYRKRLDGASNSWLLTTVTRLNQQSEQQIDMLSRSAEQRLRQTANQVFTNVGETLRSRLLDVLTPPTSTSSDNPSEST